MAQRKGEASKHLKVFQQMLCAHLQLTRTAVSNVSAAQLEERFWGEVSRKNHGIKKWKSGVTACKKFSRYTEVINLRVSHRGTASLAQVSTMGLLRSAL